MSDDNNYSLEIEGVERRRRGDILLARSDNTEIERVLDRSGIVQLNRETQDKAFQFAKETGRGVVVQGAVVQVTITETATLFHRGRTATITYEAPVIKLLEKNKGGNENVSYQ